ncbi:DinB family protein [Actinotalea sp. K2]|uniref:DinB family protein n=1 Tax=Actinotalea sp. K2 TaxID=2939438 RepID=UPI0020171AC2|nr:DinB family protein [Actinotalea sp. K2]MCL3861683.1 DinB family protein [Actinotalea sp. K2]
MADDAIIPDTKDWTWVLEQPCAECGFRAEEVDGPQVPALVAECAVRWERVLTRPDVATRPAPDVWSPLEYACHVRDVFRVFDERAALMLAQDGPTFANWDQDATALAERYAEQDPGQVAVDLAATADGAAATFASVQADQWARRGFRSNGSVFTVESLAKYFVHDVVHHLHDVQG